MSEPQPLGLASRSSPLLFGAGDTFRDQAANGFRPGPDALTGAPCVQGFDFLGADDQLNSHVLFLHVGFMPEQGDECNIGDLQKLHKSLDMRNSKVCNSLHTVYGDKPMTFQLDTSGVVYVQSAFITDRNSKVAKRWSDLSPFTQGYIEALFAAFDPEPTPGVRLAPGPFGFSDLAPETLARIIADCGLAQREGDGRMEGIDYWNRRQAGEYLTTRQPQTVQLGDDGKVRLANV